MNYTESGLKKLKNDELKDILSSLNQPTLGKKEVLVNRILSLSLQVDKLVEENDSTFSNQLDLENQPTLSPSLSLELNLETDLSGLSEKVLINSKIHPRAENSELEVEDEGFHKFKRLNSEVTSHVSNIPGTELDLIDPEIVHEEEEDTFKEVYDLEIHDGTLSDMYLDTVNRQALDFDFERLCSVTLSHNNIYACLVCGKYFQGRGTSSPAYAHSLAEDHHVYINLNTQKVFVLPDGYEVVDPSLDDIKHLLLPTFTPLLLSRIDQSLTPAYDLSQKPYYPGFVGLNNIKANSYMNSIIHSLMHVVPLRNYFILDSTVASSGATELVKRFSMICRKVWNPKAFKGQVSPHEFLQECSNVSGKRFKITEAGDPLEFLSWLLNQLHKDLGGTKKAKSSIIYSAFQGELRVDDQQILISGEYGGKPQFDLDREIKTLNSTFLLLAIDLPTPPVFQDAVEKNIIPQVPLSVVLAKYNGLTTHESKSSIRHYKITRLPPFLILHIKRFTKNNFVEEKNPTIVNFPLRGIDMKEYVDSQDDVSTYYDLVSNITHSSTAGTAREETTWKTQIHLRPARDNEGKLLNGKNEDDEKWFQIQDLAVEEINRGMIALGESYIQIWERRLPENSSELKVEQSRAKKS